MIKAISHINLSKNMKYGHGCKLVDWILYQSTISPISQRLSALSNTLIAMSAFIIRYRAFYQFYLRNNVILSKCYPIEDIINRLGHVLICVQLTAAQCNIWWKWSCGEVICKVKCGLILMRLNPSEFLEVMQPIWKWSYFQHAECLRLDVIDTDCGKWMKLKRYYDFEW